MITRTSQNIRRPERGEECPTLLAIKLREAYERALAKKKPQHEAEAT